MSSQRERQEKRERERSQRQLTTPSLQTSNNNSLFGEPIRKKDDDETTKRIKSTLGDFDSVQLLLINDPKPLLGISTREITRIKGSKAKIEQILSEMKNTLEPITALDDYSDDNSNAKYSTNSVNNNNSNNSFNNSQHFGNNNNNCNDTQKSGQTLDRNSRKSNEFNDSNADQTTGRQFEEKSSTSVNNKTINCKKRKSSKSDAENGSKSYGTKRTRSTSSSEDNSSESSSNSSSISSSSSDSSDEEEEANKESDKESVKQEEVANGGQETPKAGQQPEIAVWDLESFMDKKTTTTTTTSTTVSSNSTTSFKTNSYDNIADVIDRVAKGELGESISDSSSCDSLSPPTPKKRRKSMQTNESVVRSDDSKRVQSSQNSVSKPQHKTSSKHIQQNNNHLNSSEILSQKHTNEVKAEKTEKQNNSSFSPKSLIVSIKLMLLKRIPRQSCGDSSASSTGSHRSLNSICSDTLDKSSNDDINNNVNNISNNLNINTINNNLNTKTAKSVEKNRFDKKVIKEEIIKDIVIKDIKKSKNKTNDSFFKTNSSKAQLLDNDSRNSEPRDQSRDSTNTPSLNNSVKQESVSSPPQLLPPLTNSSLLPIPPPSTSAPNITPTSSRTTPEIANSGQPDDFLSAAKRLKHAADRESDRTVQACKYLEAVLYFILTGNAMEQRNGMNEAEKVCLMYKETLNLIRQITNKFSKSRSPHSADIPTTDHKLTTLSYRCQSLLYLKLSRIKSKEIRENNKLIANQSQDLNTSANCVTIQTSLLTAIQRQLFLLQQYHTAHELWQQADHLIDKHPSCKAFFVALDNECGSLSLNSSFDHLVHYVRSGLQILK